MINKLGLKLGVILPIGISFLISITIVHYFEYFSLESLILSKLNFFYLFINYFFADFLTFILFLIFSLLVSFVFKSSNKFFPKTISFLGLIFIILNFILSGYFNETQIPLDEVLYQFNIKELKMILGSNSRVTFDVVIWFLSIIFIYFSLIFSMKKVVLNLREINKKALSILFLILFIFSLIHIQKNESELKSNVYKNKLLYFSSSSLVYFFGKKNRFKTFNTSNFKGLSTFFLSSKNTNSQYPLLHDLEEKSELAKFLKKSKKPPNIVFIIVESLSSDLVGVRAHKTGHLMPFMDSLAKESLYFPNFLSTAERTHNVLPASLSSVPNAPERYMMLKMNKPDHQSLPSLLKENYFSRFYCGVNLNYSNMNTYMNFIQTDYLVKNWEKKFINNSFYKTNTWGHPDGAIFEKSILDLKKINVKNKAKLDIFLTISSHDPFNYPQKEKFVKKVLNRIKNKKLSTYYAKRIHENALKFGSFMYVDEQLKKFFNEVKKNKSDFSYTIFFIFGDHGSELCFEDPLSKFRIPLLIYSPLLKINKQINSVNTHLNLAPTIVNYLRTEYHLKIAKSSSFIGNEIDFSKGIKFTNYLPFNTLKLKNEFLLYGKYYLENDKLFKLNANFNLNLIKNNAKLKILKHQLKLYNHFSSYLYFENKFILPNQNEKQTKSKLILFNENKKLDSNELKNEFISIGKDNIKIPSKVKQIKISVSCDIYVQNKKNTSKLPLLVLAIDQFKKGKMENCFWNANSVKFKNKLRFNDWNAATFDLKIEVKDLEKLNKKNALHFYLYNYKKIKFSAKNFETKVYFIE
jgi:hypothetical protein